MPQQLRLISHKLCPYVQRAVIVAKEKEIPFVRIDIDLANKPDWFLAMSPTGKVPLLEVVDQEGTSHFLFESAVIAEYLDDIAGKRLLPADSLARARERAWIEIASTALVDISQLYSAPTGVAFEVTRQLLNRRLSSLETEIAGPWFAGMTFGLVDAAFGPVFRYVDVFEPRLATRLIDRSPKLTAWRKALAERPSVAGAVPTDYEEQLVNFVGSKQSHLARQLTGTAMAA